MVRAVPFLNSPKNGAGLKTCPQIGARYPRFIGLIASTSNLSNANCMAGRLEFDQPGRPGAGILNQGALTAREGGGTVVRSPDAERLAAELRRAGLEVSADGGGDAHSAFPVDSRASLLPTGKPPPPDPGFVWLCLRIRIPERKAN